MVIFSEKSPIKTEKGLSHKSASYFEEDKKPFYGAAAYHCFLLKISEKQMLSSLFRKALRLTSFLKHFGFCIQLFWTMKLKHFTLYHILHGFDSQINLLIVRN